MNIKALIAIAVLVIVSLSVITTISLIASRKSNSKHESTKFHILTTNTTKFANVTGTNQTTIKSNFTNIVPTSSNILIIATKSELTNSSKIFSSLVTINLTTVSNLVKNTTVGTATNVTDSSIFGNMFGDLFKIANDVGDVFQKLK
jgi:hypothetical protein